MIVSAIFLPTEISCTPPMPRQHSDVEMLASSYLYTTTLRHHCHVGYHHNQEESFNSTCTIEGYWTNNQTECEGRNQAG